MNQSIYAALLLFIMSQSCAKMSVISFVGTLTPVVLHHRMALALAAITAIWTIIALFGFAFACKPPSTWDYGGNQCIDIKAFYAFVEAASAVIDVLLVTLPVRIISNLQLVSKRKFTIVAFFSSRLM
jgi:hypothetical protein